MPALRSITPRLLTPALLCGVLLSPAPTPAEDGTGDPTPSILDDPVFTARLGPALDRLYDFDLTAAEAELAALAARHPGHPAGPLLAALADWWRTLVDPHDRSRDEAIEARIDEVLAAADARLQIDPEDADGLFFRAAALALRGRIGSLRGRWISAAWDGKRALALVRRLAAREPDNTDLLFGLGAYDYCAEAVPARYPIFRPLVPFFPEGDRERGLAALERVKRDGRFAHTEAAWLLAQLNYLFEDDRAGSLEQLHWLRARYPDNPLFHAFEGRVHARWHDCRRAEAVYGAVLDRAAAGRAGYAEAQEIEAHYQLGRCAVETGRFGAAAPHLSEVERLTAGDRPDSPYRTLAQLRLGMAADGLGERSAAVRHYRAALALPDAAEAHERARRYLRRPYL